MTVFNVARQISDNLNSDFSIRLLQHLSRKVVISRARHVAKRTSYPLLHEEAFATFPSKTLFILGSGASVEDLQREDFSVIADGFSVGVNAWPVHDFIPTAYAFEPCRNPAKRDAISHALQRQEIHEKPPLILFEINSLRVNRTKRISIPDALIANIFLYAKLPSITKNPDILIQSLRNFLLQAKEGKSPEWLSFGQNASIERLALLGVTLGFTDIVFVGVDLNNTSYFWEKNPEYLTRRGLSALESGQTGSVHKTADPKQKPIPTQIVIKIIAQLARKIHGADLWVSSPKSALAEFLPVYQFR